MEVKDVFVIHTKGDGRHRELVDSMAKKLEDAAVPLWTYEDWTWEKRFDTGRSHWEWSGRVGELDPWRAQAGMPAFRRREQKRDVDLNALDHLLTTSAVVVALEPERDLSKGMILEMERTAKLLEGGAPDFVPGLPNYLLVSWPDRPARSFAPLAHAATVVKLPGPEAVDDLMAAIACGIVLYEMEGRGGVAGRYLMHRCAQSNEWFAGFASRSLNRKILDFPALEAEAEARRTELEEAEKSTNEPNLNDLGSIRDFMRKMDLKLAGSLKAHTVERWWNHEAQGLRTWHAGRRGTPMLDALAEVINIMDTEHGAALDRFAICDTVFKSAAGV